MAPARTRQQLQQDAWGDYIAQRDAAVEARWAALSRRARRQTSLPLLRRLDDIRQRLGQMSQELR